MFSIEYNKKISGKLIDARYNNTLVLFKNKVKDLRNFQTAVLYLASLIAEHTELKGVLILEDSRISYDRITKEWADFRNIIKYDVFDRLSAIGFSKGIKTYELGFYDSEQEFLLQEIRNHLYSNSTEENKKSEVYYEVLKILLINYFRKSEPLKINQLQEYTGVSYPTISASLDKLQQYITRKSDRSVSLRTFPKDEWAKLISLNNEIREPKYYTSAVPKPIDLLQSKFNEIANESIALGGIIGARYYYPAIDLLGIHRMDICTVQWTEKDVNEFIRKLDPTLRETNPGEKPQVVINKINRQFSFFNQLNNTQVADEVECLLDLHDAKLEGQAFDMLNNLKMKVAQE